MGNRTLPKYVGTFNLDQVFFNPTTLPYHKEVTCVLPWRAVWEHTPLSWLLSWYFVEVIAWQMGRS